MDKKFLKKNKEGIYLMAKEAHHLLGEVSRDEWDLAIVFQEDDENLYGNWVFGFGLIDVRFPKKSVRQLDKKDLKKYDSTGYGINAALIGMLKVKDYLWRKK